MTANEIRNAILTSTLTSTDINLIVDAVNVARKLLTKSTIRELAVNDRVTWVRSKTGTTGIGIVKKVSRTTVMVLSDEDNLLWRIPGGMLKVV
jgi:hypothetical protein